MSAGQQYKAIFKFVSTGDGILSFSAGDQFTLVSKTDENWWQVRSSSGEKGLAPISYLEACPIRNGGPVRSALYTTLYDYTAQDSQQMSFSRGKTMSLVDKTDVSWWTMKTADGMKGLVPVNYIDKLDTVSPSSPKSNRPPSPRPSSPNRNRPSSPNRNRPSSPNRNRPPSPNRPSGVSFPERPPSPNRVSYPNATKMPYHNRASPPTRASPKRVSPHMSPPSHRKSQGASFDSSVISVGSTNNPPIFIPPTPSQSVDEGFQLALESIDNSISRIHADATNQGGMYSASQKETLQKLVLHRQKFIASHEPQVQPPQKPSLFPQHNPVPKRHAPPPPVSPTKVNGSTNPSHLKRESSELDKSKQNHSKENRYSLQINQEGGVQPNNSFRRSAPVAPSTSKGSLPYSSHDQFYSLQRHPRTSPPKSQASTLLSSPNTSPRRYSVGSSAHGSPGSPAKGPLSDLTRQRSGSAGSPGRTHKSASSSSQSSRSNSRERESFVPQPMPVVVATPPPLALPVSFSSSDGAELVETVRKAAGITHRKAQQAVGGVLQFIKTRVPVCEPMVDGLFEALEKAMHENSVSTVPEQHSDLERLKEILFEITECKDDSQQRGWAVHDDEKAISDLLEEMLQILCDANPEVSKVAIMEDKYENVLTLITYYQMEPRVPIRLLLLKVFGLLCGLDKTVIGILLSSVLPNELGRDIQQNLDELQKALYSSTVCTMIFSSADPVPLSVYDQWDVNYVCFLLDTIESPPSHDFEDQLPDAFLNMVLAFNQHFPDHATNLVMKGLKKRTNPRNFSEKLMFLINRGEDPVAISEPCCPDSITKFLLDLFSSKSTAGMFYTTDMRVLIDIVVRQLTDLCPDMPTRTHYLELLYRIVDTTDYREHLHRQHDLMTCLNRVASEEEEAGIHSIADKKVVNKIWKAFPRVFDEAITDL